MLKALADLDVGEFAVFRSGVATGGNQPTSGRKQAYWFPDEKVKANDLIVLYTKKGSRSSKRLESGHTAYFFIGVEKVRCGGTLQFGAVVIEVMDWEFRVAE